MRGAAWIPGHDPSHSRSYAALSAAVKLSMDTSRNASRKAPQWQRGQESVDTGFLGLTTGCDM